MKNYQAEFIGSQPLLLHHDNIEWADQMEEWRNDPANKSKSKAGDDRTPAFRWIGCLYHDAGLVAIPQENIMRCLMEGGTMVPVPGGRSGKTFKSQTQSGMMSLGAFWTLYINGGDVIQMDDINPLLQEEKFSVHKDMVEALGFSLMVKRAKVGQSKHIRVRPRFHNWKISGRLVVWDEQLDLKTLQSIADYSGRYKGLCDWRPGGRTPGPFGMFKAELKEV